MKRACEVRRHSPRDLLFGLLRRHRLERGRVVFGLSDSSLHEANSTNAVPLKERVMVGASKRANMNPLEAVKVELPLKRCELAVPKITRKDIIAEGTCVEYAKTLAIWVPRDD